MRYWHPDKVLRQQWECDMRGELCCDYGNGELNRASPSAGPEEDPQCGWSDLDCCNYPVIPDVLHVLHRVASWHARNMQICSVGQGGVTCNNGQ